MIIHSDFVWLHFPKCAGTRIESLFKEYLSSVDGLIQDPVGISGPQGHIWHDTIDERRFRDPAFKLSNRAVICSFRRLPAWLESRYNYEFQRSPSLPHDPNMLLRGEFLESNGYRNNADYVAQSYLPEALFKSNDVFFIRTENFAEDFKAVFSKFIDVSSIPIEEINSKENQSKGYLSKEYVGKLNEGRTVYDACPYWSWLESIAYSVG